MFLSETNKFHVRAVYEESERGLFASRGFRAGEEIYRFDYWSQELMPMHVTNHSCAPNASFNQDGMLVALRRIEAGEEITFHYLQHPIPASPWNFKCRCGANECLGWIEAKQFS